MTVLGDDVSTVIGEARLAYGDARTLRLVETDDVSIIEDDDTRLATLRAAADSDQWSEASVDEMCERRFGVVRDGVLLSVATLRNWEHTLGHVGVFTGAGARGRGLACTAASAAVGHAQALGLTPQWRSQVGNDASTRVAGKLGFVELGSPSDRTRAYDLLITNDPLRCADCRRRPVPLWC